MTQDETDVVVIGAGAAGLAAARELSAARCNVIVLEARDRIGGRINTHFDEWPIELGAEFVHGKPPETFAIVERAQLKLDAVPNRHWHFHDGIVTRSSEFWSKVEAVMDEMSRYRGRDEDFAHFVHQYKQRTQIEDVESIAKLYVEGFHAAHADRISVHGLNETNEAAAEIDDEKQFRVQGGYKQVATVLHDDAVIAGAKFYFNAVVEEVNWRRNQVQVTTRAGEIFKARCLLITLPLGLLQHSANEDGRVRFTPALNEHLMAASKLAMGHVVKVMLRFREPFWEDLSVPSEGGRAGLKDFAFIHGPAELLPTWWTQFPERVPVLTGWAGGTRAEGLSKLSDDSLLDQSLQTLTHIFHTSKSFLEELLQEFYTHNWQKDPFAVGAYSYIPVGGVDAREQLARALDETIFFAGEATNTEGHHGTVHGAIATGLRAAGEIREVVDSAKQY